MYETKIIVGNATTVYINHPEASYAIFCFNEYGDLFMNSDWGFYGYAWRHYGDRTFKEFLQGLNSDYLVGKFAINFNQDRPSKQWLKGIQKENVTKLIELFLTEIKKQL